MEFSDVINQWAFVETFCGLWYWEMLSLVKILPWLRSDWQLKAKPIKALVIQMLFRLNLWDKLLTFPNDFSRFFLPCQCLCFVASGHNDYLLFWETEGRLISIQTLIWSAFIRIATLIYSCHQPSLDVCEVSVIVSCIFSLLFKRHIIC